MSKWTPKQKDRVEVMDHYIFGGQQGEVSHFGDNGREIWIKLDGEEGTRWFTQDELAPVTAPEPAGEDMSEDAFDAVGVHRMIPGLWRITQENGITNMELVNEDSDEPAGDTMPMGLTLDEEITWESEHRSEGGNEIGSVEEALIVVSQIKRELLTVRSLIGSLRAERDDLRAENARLLKEINVAKQELALITAVNPDRYELSELAYAAFKADYENLDAARRYLDSLHEDEDNNAASQPAETDNA